MFQNTFTDKDSASLNFYTIFWLFMIGSVVGFILEGIWCILRLGYWENHSAVIWGPFCIIYGLGIVGVYLLNFYLSSKHILIQFLTYMIVGTLLEYICSLFQEACFGSISWNYSKHFMNFDGRISLQMMLMWGVLGTLFAKLILPSLNHFLARLHTTAGIVIAWILIIFMIINLTVTCAAVTRWHERLNNIPSDNPFEQVLDNRYDNQTMEKLYPTMRFI